MRGYISSGFDQLNELLGKNGFEAESIILLRGEPGTGKSTLAFQIAHNILKNKKYSDNHQCSIVFACIENKAEIALNKILNSFYKKYNGYENFLAKHQQHWRSINLDYFVEKWLSIIKTRVENKSLNKIPDKSFIEIWQNMTEGLEGPYFIVIDSLDALIYAARRYYSDYDDREMLLTIFSTFQEWWNNEKHKAAVIFTAEDSRGSISRNAESYIADTVIELRRETPNYRVFLSPNNKIEWKEDLLFCQVMKGRGLRTQRRPLCYEFVQNKGIDFFPTYAAQGLVSLFYENNPQHEVIQNIRQIDFPSSYPGVEVQEFTRPYLQRMFAVRRYQRKIPPRHPMLVSHVDEYWVEVLKRANLLYRIPRKKLKLFSFSDDDDKRTSIISEIEESKQHIYKSGENYLAVPQMGNVGMLVYRKDLLDNIGVQSPPETWEDLEAICQTLKDKGLPYKFLIETTTYDTLLITAIELAWSHGAFWKTEKASKGKLKIFLETPEAFNNLCSAIKKLQYWTHELEIVPYNSSVDPENHPKLDWVFARHWYSTWIDVITRTDEKSRKIVKMKPEHKFDVARLPISRKYKEYQIEKNAKVMHHSGLGEWYLMIQSNTENVELGIDIINNLMSSRKITERALSGVEIPVVEKFYELYGESICFGTNKTFNSIRKMFFEGAKSRTLFYEYRTVARILFGPLRAAISNSEANIEDLLLNAFREIDSTFKL